MANHSVHCFSEAAVVVRPRRSRAVDGPLDPAGVGPVGRPEPRRPHEPRPADGRGVPRSSSLLRGVSTHPSPTSLLRVSWPPDPTWPPGGGTQGRRSVPILRRAVTEIVARVVPLVSSCSGEELVTTIVGGMRLADYLPRRGPSSSSPTRPTSPRRWGCRWTCLPGPALQALEVVSALAVARDLAGPLLRAALGRSGFPDGFSAP